MGKDSLSSPHKSFSHLLCQLVKVDAARPGDPSATKRRIKVCGIDKLSLTMQTTLWELDIFLLTKVSFSIHKGWQSLITANNVIAVQCGFIYTASSFISNTVKGSRSNLHLYSLLLEPVTGMGCCQLSLITVG